MLDAFVAENREEIIRRCRAKVETRSIPTPTPAELEYGIPQFLDELVDALQNERSAASDIGASAARHGRNLDLQGFTVSQVVHDYGDVCQSITDFALQLNAPISVDDFRTLNRCLDDAIARAVRSTRVAISLWLTPTPLAMTNAWDAGPRGSQSRGHGFRRLRGASVGNVGVGGSTGCLLQRSLSGLRDLIDRSVAEVRLRHDVRERSQFGLAEFIEELAHAATLEAGARGLSFHLRGGESRRELMLTDGYWPPSSRTCCKTPSSSRGQGPTSPCAAVRPPTVC